MSAVAVHLGLLLAADGEFDENQVTPGIVGFIATFAIMAIVLLLVLDMVRRIRRVNYRAEAQERLDAEEAARAEGGAASTAEHGDDEASDPPVR
ncbi:hypothetical protein ACGGZK_10305 [Agromyces sp. MMS24-K17]|uniref:hypothetical protein n=1 Tax=Agromyces sp. MMS24-K17 TaxID=3372850 RepID=UPI0037553425